MKQNATKDKVTTREKTFNWLFDTVAAITCMSASSFWEAFRINKPKLLQKDAGCVAANGSIMNSLGVFALPMTIRDRKFVHPVTVVEDINDNIIGIDFMHVNKMNYDTTSMQITFAHMLTNALYSVKEITIPALSSMMVNTKYKDDYWQLCTIWHHPCQKQNFGCSWIWTRRVLTTKWTNNFISDFRHSPKFPKVPKTFFSKIEIEQKENLHVPNEYKQCFVDILYKRQEAICINKFHLGQAKSFTHKIHLKDNNPVS